MGVMTPFLLSLLLQQQPAKTTVTVATFNLYNRPLRRETRLERAAALLRETAPDIVALQEVARVWWYRDDPSEFLASTLQLQRSRYWLEDGVFMTSGLGLLSRYPIVNSAIVKFSHNKFWDQKGFLHAVLDTPAGALGVVNVHMSSVIGGPVKERQFAELDAFLKSFAHDKPVLLLGDFNEDHQTPIFSRFLDNLRHSFGATSLYDQHAPPPGRKTWAGAYGNHCDDAKSELLDYIFLLSPGGKMLRFLSGKVWQAEGVLPSDHCPVIATVGSE